jgi:hypothetical protein
MRAGALRAIRAGSAPSGSAPSAGAGSGPGKDLRECLVKHGLTHTTQAQISEALKKCGSFLGARGGSANISPAAAQIYKNYAACMRENGAYLPEPNTSGTGPLFDTKGIDTHTPQRAAARAKCRTVLGRYAGR